MLSRTDAIEAIAGDPRPMLGQEMRWVPRSALRALEFPDADAKLIEMLCAEARN